MCDPKGIIAAPLAENERAVDSDLPDLQQSHKRRELDRISIPDDDVALGAPSPRMRRPQLQTSGAPFGGLLGQDGPTEPTTLSHLRILLVEDDVTNRNVTLLMLDHLGYRADVAENGVEALAAVEGAEYQVILMDVQMPEMDGMEATRRIRSELSESDQPFIVAITAGVTIEHQLLCLEAGMDHHLPKPIRLGNLRTVLEIATERLELQRDRRLLESRLRQSERLESLGYLAGGIAHDFNNLLAVILNYSQFVKRELDDRKQALADLDQIHAAAERAIALTRQLLAFARREVLQPRIVNLNDLLKGIEQLLRLTIGENIEFVMTHSEDLWSLEADPGQLEQVLVNLTVNARYAMPEGGLLCIDTGNVEIGTRYAEMHPGLAPGRYVRLRVSDTGSGMEPSVLEHIFEPFFTTKPQGEGTGLGLATVFGIVTQAGGEIQLYSKPGMGTTCRVLFPASERSPLVIRPPIVAVEPQGTETVLVVEDEAAQREMTRRILEENGYEVLVSANGPGAIILAESHDETIHLLLSDVIMPEMPGNEVAAELQALRPGLRVLYMSGYAQPVLGSTLGDDAALLEKPFTEQLLLLKVRETLDRAR
jgi:signal transduction histidine kinase